METQDKFAAPILGFVSLAQVKKLPDKSRIAVIGIVRAVGGLKKFSSKEGRAIEKREFALVDDSNTKVFCTLWGQVARDFEAAKIGRVYALLAVSISDYSGSRSLNLNGGASILPHPAISRSDDLNTWYTTVQPDHAFAVLP
ncbi:DAN Replication protein [Phytophthora megakarya]|uniref:DAN Replication protein n=1 Tax=Phytophthora megakarya TaxID=4795 RepID=A0A225WZQ2_9STRA|nr:DAN Replication protein [Phytophthora megakarya]